MMQINIDFLFCAFSMQNRLVHTSSFLDFATKANICTSESGATAKGTHLHMKTKYRLSFILEIAQMHIQSNSKLDILECNFL